MNTILDSISTIKTKKSNSATAVNSANCTIEIVTTDNEFDKLEEAWNHLLNKSDVTIFQSFEWLRTWWKYFSNPKYKLHILLFKYDGNLVGIAPLFEEHTQILGINVVTRIQFLGCGLSDYVDILIREGYEDIVLNKFVSYCHSSAKKWDILDIEDVNERSPLVQQLPSILKQFGITVYQYQGNICPQISLASSSEVLASKQVPTTSYNFKRKFKKLQKNFKTEVEVIQHEIDDIRGGIEAFSNIHGLRWKSLGYHSAFDDEKHRAFHVEFSQKFASRGWLKLYFLKVNNQPVAASYNFNFRKRIYMYHSNAHGSDEVMKYSPGHLIRSISMTDGIAEGMELFDYLRGEEPYKYIEWKSVPSKNYLLRLSSPRWQSRPSFMLFLIYELMSKSWKRIKREHNEYRRFCLTKTPTRYEKLKFVQTHVKELFTLGFNFILRHLPFKFTQGFQMKKNTNTIEKVPKHKKSNDIENAENVAALESQKLNKNS